MSLIGKTWLKAYQTLFWSDVNLIKSILKDVLIRNFPNVFADGSGTIKGTSVLILKRCKTSFLTKQTVHFAQRKATNLELKWLTKDGILKSVIILNGLAL